VQLRLDVVESRIQAYRTDRGLGRFLVRHDIDSLKQTVPGAMEEIKVLARTLTARAADIPGYFLPYPYMSILKNYYLTRLILIRGSCET